MSMKKLQAEIDRVLKKVSEGVEVFDSIYDKIQSSNNSHQKEKYEQDLKKETKKLQRLRDQIKTWVSSNDIKDKSALLENKKLIETLMERFKNVEREMKTKAYSKEGLLAREKLDPKEKEKADVADWISNTVDELSRQIEMAEAEVETLQGTSRKGKKDHSKMERAKELEHYIERDRWHINRLELILRLLENDQLSPDRIIAIQDDVQYYLECNQEFDFEEDELIYDDLNLEEEEEMYNIGTEDHYVADDEKPSKKSKEMDDDDNVGNHAAVSEKTGTTNSPISSKSTASSPPKPPINAAPETSSVAATSQVTDDSIQATVAREKFESSPAVVPSAWAEPIKLAEQMKATTPSSTASEIISEPVMNPSAPQISNIAPPFESNVDISIPSSLADLAPSFETIKSKTSEDLQYTNRMLDASLQFVPDLIDSERPKTYQPQTPHTTPAYYPQQPLPIFDNPAIFGKFDMDALFFIFYYQQGTYLQYLAARELKKQSWRFHKKYLTWFQRHEEPKTITNEYEQGTYIYFDYEGAWCQRKKTEFRFEYRYLEDTL